MRDLLCKEGSLFIIIGVLTDFFFTVVFLFVSCPSSRRFLFIPVAVLPVLSFAVEASSRSR
jgi:hypothetical protein